jgi:4-nitrophenyl phosphatase
MTGPKPILTLAEAQEIIDQHDHFVFDCDGVIWLDNTLIPGVLETIEYLQAVGKLYVFVTNNSSKSRQDYVEKFETLGFTGITKDHIFPTCYAAALEIKLQGVPLNSKVWVLGDTGIEQELREMGYQPVGGSDASLNVDFDIKSNLLQVDNDVKAVVVGSTKDLNYMRIATTLQYLLHNNKLIPFIGANIDRSYPAGDGIILPAGGSVVNYMQFTSNRDFINVGKPSTTFLDLVVKRAGFDKSKTIMVGDTLYTDIKFANDGDLATSLLVLSGGTKLPELQLTVTSSDESLIPKYYIDSFGKIIDLLKKSN